ncbi:MAG: hypothetical protein A4E19_19900 [Nitrospira sp. SG-bin1]|nr:MAG: hypothetical protein A4E19_19900 [Nitrospira sp. SG-bin1]
MKTPVNVLLIDDSSEDRHIYRRFLERLPTNYVVHEAKDGASGVEAAARLEPDCIILDLKLPDQSGFEVLVQLVGEDPPPKIPVIMLTSSVSDTLSKGALWFGAQQYLIKGRFEAEQLDQAIRDAVARVAALTPKKS